MVEHRQLVCMDTTRRLFTLTVFLIHFYIFDACEKYRFVPEEGATLEGHVIENMTTLYVEICWDKCVWTPKCFSINVRNNSFGMVECDLNNSSKKASPENLVPRQGSQYHEMGDIKDCNDYECKRKEDLGNEWYRLGGAAVKMFHENKTWIDARAQCQSIGGDLLSISTSYENDFIHNVLVEEVNLTSTLPEGITHHWHLDGQDSDVILRGDPGAAKYENIDGGRALYLSGLRSYADVPAVVFNPEGLTFMLWVKLANPSEYRAYIYGDWSYPYTFLMLFFNDSQTIGLWMRNEDNVGIVPSSIQLLRIQINKWNHIAFSWNKTENIVTAVLNGEERAEANGATPNNNIKLTSHSYFSLGLKQDNWPGNENTFHGHMKHLMVFNRSLNKKEIQTAMNFHKQGPWIGLNAINGTDIFKWSDGTKTQYMALPSYQANPSISGRKCVEFGCQRGRWFDEHCQEKKPFICEKRII